MVRITDVREITKPISSPIRNAYIDFSKMTLSVVAVVTDAVRDGRRVVGYGFNSNGRYGQGGLIRERFVPRLLEADPASLLDEAGSNLDPQRIWARMMTNEKPGGHGERSVAVGTIDMAVWDAVAKIAGKPLYELLAERHGSGPANPRVFVYAAGGYYYPGKDLEGLQRKEMRGYLDRGYTVVKMKIGGATFPRTARASSRCWRNRGTDAQLAVDANGRFDLDRCRVRAMLRTIRSSGTRKPVIRSITRCRRNSPSSTGAHGHRREPVPHQDARNLLRYGGMRPDRDWLQFDCALSYGLCEYVRTLRELTIAGWSSSRCIPHGGHQMSLNIAAGLGLGGNESYPDLFQPYGGFPDGVKVENSIITMPELPGIGFEGKSDLIKVMHELAQ